MMQTNHIQAIGNELHRISHPDECKMIGMLVVKTSNLTIEEAFFRPDPNPLFKSLWYEGEVCCLFADSNVGKSILAMQIANNIAENQRVILFDFELSDKQFQLRYTEDGKIYRFPENLYRVEISSDTYMPDNFEDELINDIEKTIIALEAKVVIIDNLTYLCVASEKGDNAGSLMMRLKELKNKHKLSMLVLAHTPKRQLNSPITQNDLAGSKKLFNFFDSVFAIGKIGKDGNKRYIKQIKCRNGEYEYGSSNVIECRIEKIDSLLQFVEIGCSDEQEFLLERTFENRDQLIDEAKRLHSNGFSQRAIADQLGISLGAVNKYLHSCSQTNVEHNEHMNKEGGDYEF